jgi:hypothetical protein
VGILALSVASYRACPNLRTFIDMDYWLAGYWLAGYWVVDLL